MAPSNMQYLHIFLVKITDTYHTIVEEQKIVFLSNRLLFTRLTRPEVFRVNIVIGLIQLEEVVGE